MRRPTPRLSNVYIPPPDRSDLSYHPNKNNSNNSNNHEVNVGNDSIHQVQQRRRRRRRYQQILSQRQMNDTICSVAPNTTTATPRPSSLLYQRNTHELRQIRIE